MTTGRPRRTIPMRRFNLTLDEPDAALLEAYAHELGQQPTRVAGDLVRKLLRGAKTADDRLDPHQVDTMLRVLRGEDRDATPNEPRWEWPVEAILADRRWWDRWLPDLDELLGRPKAERGRGELGTREEPIVDRRGYLDLMERLFPAITTPRGGAVSWRSPEYPQVAAPADASEGAAVIVHVWEAVIRHVVRALCALEKTAQPEADPVMGILTQDHIAGPWLRTLRTLVGEGAPDALPLKRLT